MGKLSDKEKDIIKTFCDASDIPTILLNDNLICEYSNNESIYSTGIHFASVMETDAELQRDRTVKTMVRIKDKYYCAVITAVSDEFYICQLFDADNIFEMAQFSEVYDEVFPFFSLNGIQLRRIEDSLKELVNRESVKEDCKIDSDLLLLGSKVASARGRYEEVLNYFELTFSKNNKKNNFSLYRYVKWCVDRCNTFLSDMGRYIELNCGDEELMVSANSRHAIFSFIQAIQFILLYSADDVNPFISIQRNEGLVEFMITCRGLIFVSDDIEYNLIGLDVSNNIIMVQRFAKRCNAKFSFITERNNVIGFKILFPEYVEPKSNLLVFEMDEFIDYNNEYSNYIEYKMNDVIDAYKIKNKE